MVLTVKNTEIRYTKSDLKIREFIENSTEEFLFMSIGQLAQRLQVSEATISRFARHIGYRDFKNMKNEVVRQKADQGAARKLAGTLMKNQGFDLAGWFAFQQECMEKTLENLDAEEFDRAVESICTARRIYIHAKNASAATGQLLFFRLRRLGFDVSLIPSGGTEVVEGIVHADEKDLVILFGYSKISAEGKIILDYARSAGYRTLLFTSRFHASAGERGDVNLYVWRGEEDEFHSNAVSVALVDGLILALSEKMGSESAERMIKVQKAKKRYSLRGPL